MAQLTYQLREDLYVPATGNPNKGFLYFPKSHFGLSYEVIPNPRRKTMTVILGVAELSTDEIVWKLTSYKITEQGFVTSQYANQAEYDAYILQKEAFQSELNILFENLNQIEDQSSQEYLDIQAAILLKQEQILNLVPVKLETLIINKYDDVIEYFKGDGSLTEEGVQWAKTVYYNGVLLGDLIV